MPRLSCAGRWPLEGGHVEEVRRVISLDASKTGSTSGSAEFMAGDFSGS